MAGAYRSSIERNCSHYNCKKPAKYAVFNRWNGPCGNFCDLHSKWKMTELNRLAARSDEDMALAAKNLKQAVSEETNG